MKKTLKQFVKNAFLGSALAGILASSNGCVSSINKTSLQDGANRKRVYTEQKINLGVDYCHYDINLPSGIQTTPVHPDEGGPAAGSATTDLHDGEDITPEFGYEVSYGHENLRLKVGLDAKFSFYGILRGYRSGMCDFALQTGGSGWESYAFTSLSSEFISMNPRAGIETKLFDRIVLGLDVGKPFSGFTLRTGHDRYGEWETVKKDRWHGFGESYGINLGIVGLGKVFEKYMGSLSSDTEDILFLRVRKEKYEPELLGEKTKIDSTSMTVGVDLKF